MLIFTSKFYKCELVRTKEEVLILPSFERMPDLHTSVLSFLFVPLNIQRTNFCKGRVTRRMVRHSSLCGLYGLSAVSVIKRYINFIHTGKFWPGIMYCIPIFMLFGFQIKSLAFRSAMNCSTVSLLSTLNQKIKIYNIQTTRP